MSDYDLIIRNGTVYDGSGSAPFAADVAIRDGRIAAVEAGLAGSASQEIDAQGKSITPGFIDVHNTLSSTERRQLNACSQLN